MRRTSRISCLAGALLVLAAGGARAAEPAQITLTPEHFDNPASFTMLPPEDPSFGTGTAFGLLPVSCDNGCDVLGITLDLPAGYAQQHPDRHVELALSGSGLPTAMLLNPGGALYVLDDAFGVSERTLRLRLRPGLVQFNLAVPADLAPAPIQGRIRLVDVGEAPGDESLPHAAAGEAPRFANHRPDVQGIGLFGGEATLDVNWNTGSVFYMGFLETLRVRFDDGTTPATSTWGNRPGTLNSLFTSDPLLVGDPDTGRIWAQQLIVGEGQSLSEYSDDDGETWIPGGGGSVLRSGADHQGIGVGPYPAEGPGSLIPHPLYPNAYYYCSQDIATAYCSRSDDGGLTFGPGVPLYTAGTCVGLHGHPKVAPDGTVYVPNKGCEFDGSTSILNAAKTAVVVSQDAGLSWTVKTVPDSVGGLTTTDPSVGIGTEGTVYIAWVDAATRRLHAAVSTDQGDTWQNNFDVGAIAGVRWADFPAVIAGDDDRAAIAFLGSQYAGGEPPGLEPGIVDGQSVGFDNPAETMSFQGYWHIYVAMTYDRGATWHVVNVTEGDPVQGMGGVGNGGTNRNLLDFFDATVDPQGRVLVSYEDGCVGACPFGGASTFNDLAVIARQSWGKRLFAEFDADGLAAPGPAPAPPPATDYAPACSLPGILVEDRTGEAEAQPPTRDIARFGIAEPQDMPGKLVFTIETAAAPLELHRYLMYFDILGESRRWQLDLTESGSSASYFDGGFQLPTDPTGSETWSWIADPERGLESAGIVDGAVQFVIDKAQWGLEAGDTLMGVMAWSFPTSASSSNITREEAGYEVSYMIRADDFCADAPSPAEGAGADAGQRGADVSRGGALGVAALTLLLLGGGRHRRRA